MWLFSMRLSDKFISRKQIVKITRCYVSTTVLTDVLPTTTHQIGVRANVMDKTVRMMAYHIYL